MMETILLKGIPVREKVYDELQRRLAHAPRNPGLAVVLVGEDPASKVYVRHKEKGCRKLGLHHVTHRLGSATTTAELLDLIGDLNHDPLIDGILVQLPLPASIDQESILQAVDPRKDVDGFHPENLGRLMAGQPRFIPCTPKGILRLLDYYQISTRGKRAVIVGRSVIVGRPLAMLLSLKGAGGDATVTLCHSRTPDLKAAMQGADLVIAAMGVPRALGKDMVPAGSVVIDVGINRIDDPSHPKGVRLVGDADAEALMGHVAALTPVPGGIGPMTIAMLLENTCEAMARTEGWHAAD